MSICYLYHICRKGDEGNLTKGYIGISKNPKQRWKAHSDGFTSQHLKNALRKYSDIIFTRITQGILNEMLRLEHYLRPNEKMGWNLAAGGGLPPSFKGKKRSKSFCEHLSQRQVGELNHAYGKPAHNKGCITVDYAVNPCRRDVYQERCKKLGLFFSDFKEVFAGWKVKKSGIRYRVYTYHPQEMINE